MRTRILSNRRSQSGVAVVVTLALLAIILMYVTANLYSLHALTRELRLLEEQQIKRLNERVSRPVQNPDETLVRSNQTNTFAPSAK